MKYTNIDIRLAKVLHGYTGYKSSWVTIKPQQQKRWIKRAKRLRELLRYGGLDVRLLK